MSRALLGGQRLRGRGCCPASASVGWPEINELNLVRNILPTRERADHVLHKGRDHSVEEVRLRKLWRLPSCRNDPLELGEPVVDEREAGDGRLER